MPYDAGKSGVRNNRERDMLTEKTVKAMAKAMDNHGGNNNEIKLLVALRTLAERCKVTHNDDGSMTLTERA